MDVLCTADMCPVILNSTCVFYEGNTLTYTGITTNDSLQTALQKIDAKFGDAMVGYIFTNGVSQPFAGAPVGLGGNLTEDISIGGDFTLAFAGNVEAAKHITTGGTSSDFVKGDGTLDSNAYQVAGNYITALTGDVIAAGPGSATASLAVVNSNPGTYGSGTRIPVVTVDTKGRVTALTTTAINVPSGILSFVGDVYGTGTTGSSTTLTLSNVNSNVYNSNTFLKFKVNAKGLVTGAAPITHVDIEGVLGYVPVPETRTITINGITHDLQTNASWTLPAGVASVTASAPLSATTGVNPNISIPKADASTDGYLDNVDWATFNAKQAALNGTGLVRMSGTTVSYDNTAYTPTSRTLTINGVTYDLSANRSWTINSMIYPGAGIAVSTGTAWGTSITDNSTNWNIAYNRSIVSASVTGTTSKTLTLTEQDGSTITASWTDIDTNLVTSVFGRTGAIAAEDGDYTTTLVTEGTNLYFTEQRARAAISSSVTGITYTSSTGVLSLTSGYVIPTTTEESDWNTAYSERISSASGPLSILNHIISIAKANATTDGYLSATDWNTFNSKQPAGNYVTDSRTISTTGPLQGGGNLTADRTLSITQSGASTDGYLSSTDWNTFNSKEAAIAVGTTSQYWRGDKTWQTLNTTVVTEGTNLYYTDARVRAAISVSQPLTYNSTTGQLGIQVANSTQGGYLTSTDWSTFNNKQNAGNYITALTGEATASGPGSAAVTLSTPAVTGKVLTGVNITGGSVVATDTILEAFGKLQNQINALIGSSIYKGTWNASTNTPTLTSSVGTRGWYYIVSVPGTTNLNGITDWQLGDWAIYDGTVWQKVDNTDAVVSVNGYTGAVSLVSSDIPEGLTNLYWTSTRFNTAFSGKTTTDLTEGTNLYYTAARFNTAFSGKTTTDLTEGTNLYYTPARARTAISLTTTGTSGAATYNNVTGVLNIPIYTPDLSGYVPTTRTLSINGTTYDLSADRSWTIAGSMPTGGTAGQILAKIDGTDYNTEWIDNYATQVKNQVKLGAALTKGTPVYVSGADGTNMIVSASSNTTEATSSKTFGLLETGGSTNDFVKCVTYGLLAGLDTSAATAAGDPVWLGANGTLLYGLANKPYAPLHMVYIGVVTRKQQNNGEIFVNVQNGFEMDELHNVSARNPANNAILAYNTSTSLWEKNTIAGVLGYTPEQPLTFSAPLSRSVNTISIPAATGSVNGYLSSTDWTTFNSKQAALSGTGFVKISGTTISYDNSTYLTTSAAASTYLPLTGGTLTGGLVINPANAATVGLDVASNTFTLRTDTSQPFNRQLTTTLGSGTLVKMQVAGYGANYVTDLGFYTASNSGANATPNLYLTGGDNRVGINTTTPGATLDVVGTAKVSGQLTLGSTISTTIATVTYTYTLPSASGTLALVGGSGVGTVTSVAALTIGTTGTDLSSSVANSTTTPVITLNVPTASATNRGALSAADWSTFNSKQSALTFSSPLVNTAGTISIPAATGSANGYLTSTDWTTFNSKQAALSGTGFVKISGTTISYDNSTYLTTASAASTYLALAGGTLTGNLLFSDSGTTKRGIMGTVGANDFWFVGGGATASNAGFMEIATGDDGQGAGTAEPIYVSQYGPGDPLTGTLVRRGTLLDANGNTSFPGTVTAPTFSGALSGNATTATTAGALTSMNISQFTNNSGYITSSGSISGYSNTLYSNDIRTLAPNSGTAYRAMFGFTSWANNNSAPYADYFLLRSYSDASGGSDNLITFLKSGIGMRIWQQSWGSASAFSSYVDVLHSGNYNSYSPTLTGTGASGTWGINVTGSSRSVLFSGDSTKQITDGQWAGGGSYPGYTFTGGNSRFGFSSSAGVIDVYADGNFYATDSSYLVLHTGNINSYALPLNGNWVGNTGMNDQKLYLRTNGDNNHYIWNAADDWEELVFYSGTGFRIAGSNGGNYAQVTTSGINATNMTIGGSQVWYAGNAPRAANSNLMYYAGFTLDANAMPSNSTGFTYSQNAPFTGPIAKFSEDGYPLQLNATYSGGTSIAYRTRNGDAGSWNSWYTFITTANIGSQSVNYANYSGYTSGYSTSVELSGRIWFNGSGNHNVSMYESYGVTINCVSHPWNVSILNGSLLVGQQASGSNYGIGNGYFTGDVTANGAHYASNWYRSYGNTGWYNQDYGQGLRQAKANVTYGNVIVHGENYNGWSGYNTNNSVITCFMQNSSGTHGWYQENGAGWTAFYNYGYACWGLGTDATDPSYSLHIIKYGGSNTGWIIWSDRRIKENIKTIDNALDKVLSLRGVYYNKIDDPNKERCVGYIAQEVMEVVPELVVYSEELDIYNMNYAPMVAMLTEAVKEQQAQIETLKEQVQTLLNHINNGI